MDVILEELSAGVPDQVEMARALVRLIGAVLLGAVLGIQRERARKTAGLRTHMLVALGAALFVVAPLGSGMPLEDVSRVIQGVTTGIGFIGGGAILKMSREREVKGLTTAAGLWMTAAIGVAAGMGSLGSATLSAVLAWIILAVIGEIESRLEKNHRAPAEEPAG